MAFFMKHKKANALIIGAGKMAKVRALALHQTGYRIDWVLSRTLASANVLAKRYQCRTGKLEELDNLLGQHFDLILIELPHSVQDEYLLKILRSPYRYKILVGGPMASDLETAQLIQSSQGQHHIEFGFEARYNPVWIFAKNIIANWLSSADNIEISTSAHWQPPEDSWYRNQILSGGMLLTHGSYCFINPLEYIGYQFASIENANARRLSLSGSDIAHEYVDITAMGRLLGKEVKLHMTASYNRQGNDENDWCVKIVGFKGNKTCEINIYPEENGLGYIKMKSYAGRSYEYKTDLPSDMPFVAQTQQLNLNSVEACISNMRVVAAMEQCLGEGCRVEVERAPRLIAKL